MTLSELSVRRPVLMTMIYVLIAVIAMVFLPRMEIALYPSIDLPLISVIVDCNEAGPEEIEQQVAKQMEDTFSGLENLNQITTYSSEGMCIALLEYDYGTDLDKSEEDLNTYITILSGVLPDWTETPQTIRFDSFGGGSILSLRLSSDSMSLNELKMLGENTVAPLIERVSGVAQVGVYGGYDIEYDINIDPTRLEAYGISLTEVIAAVASQNIQGTGGQITDYGINYQVATDERFMTAEDIGNTVIRTVNKVPVRISDVANVVRGEDDSSFSERYVNDEPVVMLSVSNDSDSNSTTVADAVLAELDSINAELPAGVVLELQRDSTEMIRSTMSEVVNSLVQGVILAALIIFLFLRGIKSTIIISLSMPICVLITMMFMAIFDITLNAMSMSGLILAIGMIVDASIVILENTYSYRLLGERSAIAAILGSKNMFNAICASTLTTLCVFVPIIIYKYDLEMIGVMFQDLVITVCISLGCSLFVAVTLVPALCGSILRINTRTQKPLRFRFMKRIDDACVEFENGMKRVYVRMLAYCLRHRGLIVMFLLLMLLFSFNQVSKLGISLVPDSTTDDQVTLDLELAPGTAGEVTRQYVFDMERKILSVLPEGSFETIEVSVGGGMFSSGENQGSLTVSLPDITKQTVSASEVENMIRPFTLEDPNATWTFSSSNGMGLSAIDVEIHSDETVSAIDTANQIEAILREHVPQLVNISNDANNGSPKIRVDIDMDAAADYGITASTVSSVLQTALSGSLSSQITTFDADNTYDVIVQIDSSLIQSPDDLGSLLVPTSTGGMIRLDTIASFITETSPVTITREDKERVNHVTADLMEGYAASDVQKLVDQALADYLVVPEGITIIQSGQMSQFADYGMTLVAILALALFLVYAVMAAQFESMTDPLIIFATIPLLLIGVIAIHIFMSQPISLFSVVGIVALIGTVVNNGIVLVDCINRLVSQHVPIRQACLQAAYGRLRPILMTTLTTILGMIPMAFFPGEGAEMMQPIAVTFIGGITTGAFLTLFLSPVLYTVLNARKEKHFDDPDSLNNQLRSYDMRRLKTLDDAL